MFFPCASCRPFPQADGSGLLSGSVSRVANVAQSGERSLLRRYGWSLGIFYGLQHQNRTIKCLRVISLFSRLRQLFPLLRVEGVATKMMIVRKKRWVCLCICTSAGRAWRECWTGF
jgi:hypothetical protein